MGCPCVVRFRYEDYAPAHVSRHWEGSPNIMLPLLTEFFDAVEAQCGRDPRYAHPDTRFTHPEYLAAKFVVWLGARESAYAAKIAGEQPVPLRFSNLGIVPGPCDGDFLYDVDCTPENLENMRPRVTSLGPFKEP